MKLILLSALATLCFGQAPAKCPPRVVLPPAMNFDFKECLIRSQIRELQLMSDLTDLSKGCPVDVKLADKESTAFQASLEKCKEAAKKRGEKE
jgi:hypothetical protein